MSRVVDLSGQSFGEWTVTGGVRLLPCGKQQVTRWWCTCSCGAEQWVRAGHLRSGRSPHCGKSIHRNYVWNPGDQVGEFTVISMRRGVSVLRCVCGRIRSMTVNLTSLTKFRTTCGCNGVDEIFIGGDPNLPAGVSGYCDLITWAGCTHQAHHQLIHKHGLRHALLRLAAAAEKNHLREGWRVLACVPCPAEGPPPRVRHPNGAKTLARVMPVIREIQFSGVITMQGIANELIQQQVTTARGQLTWKPAMVDFLLYQAARDLIAEAEERHEKRTKADAQLEKQLLASAPTAALG